MMKISHRIFALGSVFLAALPAFANFDGPAPVAWRWADNATQAPGGQPVVSGNSVFVAVGGRIYSIDRVTGNTNWRFPAGEPVAGNFLNGCAMKDGVVVAGSDEKNIYAVDANTGALKWQYFATDEIGSNVVIAGNYAVFGNKKNELQSLNMSNGNDASGAFRVAEGLLPQLKTYEGSVLYATARGSLEAFNPSTQKVSWTQKFSRLNSRGAFSTFEDRIYVNSGSYLVALRGSNGRVLWQQNIGRTLDSAPTANAEYVATVSQDGMLYTYNANGRPLFPKGVRLSGAPIVEPSFVGKFVCASMQSGAMVLIDPVTGDIVWNYVLPALIKPDKEATQSSGGGGGGAGGSAGAGGGGNTQNEPKAVAYTQAAGAPIVVGDSLFALARDGSLFMFDKNVGVDKTAPTAEMVWPIPGNEVSGNPPMQIIFQLADFGIGINPDTIKVEIGGQAYLGELVADEYYVIKIAPGTVNRPLQNGKQTINFTISDWLGNAKTHVFRLQIDNSLPALGSPPTVGDNNQGGPGGPGGGRQGGGGLAGGGGAGGL
ncbi:MAG: PQQ-binding-like beta-propeller repeat protein [Armatimonadetes bacterium]|nr:PQQ-binding-like beta-propeller repeat protein [Armatimonadota bacterium]